MKFKSRIMKLEKKNKSINRSNLKTLIAIGGITSINNQEVNITDIEKEKYKIFNIMLDDTISPHNDYANEYLVKNSK